MINKKLGMFIAPVLLLGGLVACTNRANEAIDRTKHNGPLNVSYRGDGINHNGPLTENYDVNRYRGNGFKMTRFNDKYTGYDMNPGPLHVSSMFTTLSSDLYPHTRAILVQHASYQFVPMYPSNGSNNGTGYPGNGTNYGIGYPGNGTNYGMGYPQQAQGQAPTNQTPAQQWRAPSQPSQSAPAQPSAPKSYSAPTQGISQFAQQVINLTNVQRAQNGLPALKADVQLSGVAQKKADEMQQKNYFSHTSPTYGSPFDMMRDFGVTYSAAGENIAMGQRTPQEVVTAWMNSPGHRANILNRSFTNIGVGVEQSGYHWSQMFIGK